MSDMGDRRARKKAATRALVLETAQRLFDERGFDDVTIADIAARADVAVQTVFNHFATKEDLFFADRTPWVRAAADAVRTRSTGESAMDAVHRNLVAGVQAYIAEFGDPATRRYLTTMSGSPNLKARERELTEVARSDLEEAFVEAWTATSQGTPEQVRVAAALVSSVWIATARAVTVAVRDPLPPSEAVGDRAREAAELADTVLTALDGVIQQSVVLSSIG